MDFKVGDEVIIVSDEFFLGSALPKGSVSLIRRLVSHNHPFIALENGWGVEEKDIILVRELSDLEKLLYDVK